ncbi:MAG TPA: hypothetical protein VF469_13560 [Kofleriaceae bacterium]
MLKEAPSGSASPRGHLRLRARRDGSRVHVDITAHGWAAIVAVVVIAAAIAASLLLK